MRIKFFIFILLLCFCGSVYSQNSDTLNKKRLYVAAGTTSALYVGGISYLSFVWYKDKKRVPFHYYNDLKGDLQMDKWGHAYTAYYESMAVYNALRWAGVSEKKALIFGGPAGLLFQTPIEVFDGLYEKWGFSWGDMAANTFGSALFTAQQLLYKEQRIRMKFSYSPSPYPEYHHLLGETEFESFFLDYNAHTYWFSGNIADFNPNQKRFKWLNVAVGYSAEGIIKTFENPTEYRGEPFPDLPRYRQYLLSLDVDFSKIETKRKGVRLLLGALNLVKIPFPAIEFSGEKGVKFRPLYF